jgi:DNA-binding CsgD family transcriptional regulator
MSLSQGAIDTDDDAGLTLSEAQVLTDCAYSAGGPDRHQSGTYILERLRGLIHADAAAILAWNPLVQHHVVVSNLDYPPPTLDGLSDAYLDTDPHNRMLATRRPLRMFELPYDFRETEMYQEVIAPPGFRDGMTTPLFAEDGSYAGMLHLSSSIRGTFQHRHPTLLSAIAPSIGKLCTIAHPRALATEDSTCRAVVDAAGHIQPIDPRGTLTLASDPRLVAVAAAFLSGGDETILGLWPSSDGWLRVRMDRIEGPVHSSDAAAMVTETPVRLPYGLTDREVDMLTGIAQGFSNQEIASRHSVSFRTTTTHVERILSKLDERSRTGAAVRAVREGLTRLDSRGSG